MKSLSTTVNPAVAKPIIVESWLGGPESVYQQNEIAATNCTATVAITWLDARVRDSLA